MSHSDRLFGFETSTYFQRSNGILGNTLILVALHREASPYPPSKLLLRTLATTDLCVSNIAEPIFVTYFMSVMNERWHICHYAFRAFHIAGYILSGESLFTMTSTAVNVGRLALLLVYTVSDLLFNLSKTESFYVITKTIKKLTFPLGRHFDIQFLHHSPTRGEPSLKHNDNLFDIKKEKSKDYYFLLTSKKADILNTTHTN